jgi:acetyl esterase/lipase
MVELNTSVLKPHVNEFLKMDLKRTLKNAAWYLITRGISISKFKALMGKVLAANDRGYQMRTVDLEKAGAVLTDKEIMTLIKVYRYTGMKAGKEEWKKYKAPAGLKIDRVDAGGVPAEWQTLPGAAEDKVLLYFHGGGFCLLSPATHRPFTVEIAKQGRVKVLSVDYRLMPENSFQDMLSDCLAAYKWLLASGVKPGNVIIGGDSGGGFITLRLLSSLQGAGLPFPGGAVCISPMVSFDLGDEAMWKNFQTDPIIGTSGIAMVFLNIWKAIPNSLKESPDPLKSSLKGWPPLLVQATTCEMIFDQCQRLVEKAKAAGVPAELQAWDGMIHVFEVFGYNHFPEAKEATTKIAAFINESLKI